jgi:transposase
VEKMNKRKGKAPPRYDEAFKEGAVKLVTEQGRNSREVAEELGICHDTLRNWLKIIGVKAGNANRNNRETQRLKELEAQNRELKKQLAEKQEIIDVLKKSVGILSKP